MSASRSADGSVFRTGLSHVALSLGAFGILGVGAIGAAFLFGDAEASGPRIELALYSAQNGPPPILKNRSPIEALDTHAAEETPDLGIDYEDGEYSDGDGHEATITVTEIASTAARRRRSMRAPSMASPARRRSR
jgi:hypothetical protein